jgi:Lrp/AsnC family leucine-responsive transcriptional regulator
MTAPSPQALDPVDRRLLALLQKNGRISFEELAREVQLSSVATMRRVRRLEESGVITGYAALVPPEQVGLGLTVYLNVRLDHHGAASRHPPMEQFRNAVQGWPEVADCLCLSGEMDYLLRVVVQDMAHYSRFLLETLLRHPGVLDCRSSFVLERLKTSPVVPV